MAYKRGVELKSKGGKTFLIKSRYPSGQLKYTEDHYDIICEAGSFRLNQTILNYLFDNETERKQKEDEKKLTEMKEKESKKTKEKRTSQPNKKTTPFFSKKDKQNARN